MTTEGMEQWDLTSKISPYLDRHMMFPLLEYMDGLIADGTVSYSTQDVAAARLALLRPTHMVDYAIDIYKTVHPNEEIPAEMEEQKTSVYQRLEELEKGCKALHELCSNEEEKVRWHVHACIDGSWSVAGLSFFEGSISFIRGSQSFLLFSPLLFLTITNYDSGQIASQWQVERRWLGANSRFEHYQRDGGNI
jgi:hypothetical protein